MLNQPTSSPMIMMMLGFGCWAATGTAVSATAMKSATRTSHPLRFGHRIALSLAFQAIEPRAHSHRRISPSSFLLHRTTVVVFAETTWLLDLRPTAMEPSDRLSHSSIPADRRPTRSIGLFAIDPSPHRERRQSQPGRWCVQRWLIRFQMIPVIYDLLGRIAR